MAKYMILTTAVVPYEYIVEANSPEEAEEVLADSGYESVREGIGYDFDAEETIHEVTEIKPKEMKK